MKIKTRLHVITIFSVAIALVTGSIVFLTAQRMNKEINRNTIADEVARGVFELNIITYEYLLHHEERMLAQWQLRDVSLTKLLSELEFKGTESQVVLVRIQQNHKGIKSLFPQLVEKYKRRGNNRKESTLSRKLEERLVSHLLVKSQSMVSDAFRLASQSQAAMAAAQQRATLVITVFIIFIIAIMAVVSYIFSRSVAKPIRKLHEGTEIIGAGNLNYRVGTPAKDEIGQLSRAFDEMTGKRKKAEEELQRVNRALRTLSECNQVLVRTADEKSLLHEICRVIVEVGGYRLAWVGYAEQDEAKTVRPVAKAGYDEGHLDTLDTTWADTERGHGTTGTAIRTGKPSICKDMLTDPHFVPWRAEAIKRGYASSIVLPLIENNQIIGSLNIYATEPDAFVEEEIKLLTELANDLSYGIIALRTHAERKRLEKELERLKRQYELILNAAGEGIFGVDLNGNATFVNPAAAKMLGFEPQELIGKCMHKIHHHSKPDGTLYPREECPICMAFKDGKVYFKDNEFFWRKDGTSFPVEYASTPIRENGSLIGAVVTFKDITRRRKAEEEVKKYREHLEELVAVRAKELEDANLELKSLNKELELRRAEAEDARLQAISASRAKSDFLANMSHELRTPMNSIIGFSEILQDELYGELNEKQMEYIADILSSGTHLLNLINDILDLSKVESGKMEPDISEFKLRDLIESSFVLFKEKAMKHSITLGFNIEPGVDTEIGADERKLKQILFNLLSNAMKFTPDGGSISVRAKKVSLRCEAEAISKDEILRSAQNDKQRAQNDKQRAQNDKYEKDFIEISVEDTGIGIRSDDIDKLFKEFSQLETPYEKKYEGTGLGLALTKKLVELHGGRIWIESEYGKGSKFSFIIPIRQRV